ncbi:isopenicillin-N N-acyltransferase-like protein [Leucobacter luti]|uniref:Isopenicillin-N N-acyltransferase-like protein n=1 Tax=Leucobacter luti TaxID=340320 RepID=A0A4R6RWP2_9MICO|nr:C45 family peptidase [Leucobacter luti]TDP91472.1 isopenicillin-N N-acyltransferase-like protein [Leucobacter luti]
MSPVAPPPRYPRYRVSGDAATRSHQYGALARTEVQRTRAGYERAFAAKGVRWEDAVEYAMGFVPAIEQYFPELLTELRGIADGSGVSFADVVTMNCRTEVLWRAGVTRAANVAAAAGVSLGLRGECSGFALEPDRTEIGRVLVGQNWDWLETLADGVIVLEVERPEAPNFVTIVEAGLLAKMTMNQAGMAVSVNTMVSSLDGGVHGVPFHVLVRALADAETVSDVVDIVASVPRAASGNFIVGGEQGAILTVETAPGDTRTVRPISATRGVALHTNHFVHQPLSGFDLAVAHMSDSFVRYGRLERRISHAAHPLTISALQLALADHAEAPNAVCCHPDRRADPAARWATLAAVIMDPAARTLHFAEGTPCATAWSEHDYSELLGRAAQRR